MNKVDVLTRESYAALDSTPSLMRRPPPRAAKVLLPVWGYRYVRQFLECGLPTLLAPGNVPAVAHALSTEFVLLTSVDDEEYIREHANFQRLATVCKTEIRAIDHLITDRNYSTTITLAYTEAVRAAGESMLDTCFFFLVSDYIMADGSLAGAVKRMQQGISALIVGNFQVAEEDALPWLEARLAISKSSLAIAPREMMRWALNHLHPATLANVVNIPFSHNTHTNRLFWRVDASTILGRFYLMHMLCVRPETTEFIIGASCDYSFIPEMCPSGNVEVIPDSDEYLVIELQPLKHESAFLRPGPLTPGALAKSLNEWTTQTHRHNVKHSVVFHAGDLPPQLSSKIAEADDFLDRISRHLKLKPLPYRGHPYWRGAMATFYDATGRKLNEQEWRWALGMPASEDPITQWLLWHAKFTLMGQPPNVSPWHPAWPDFKTVFGELKPFFVDPKVRLLLLSNDPTAFSLSLADSGERVHRLRYGPFLRSPVERYAPLQGKFDLCLLELHETDMRNGKEIMDRIVPLMKNGGRVILSVANGRVIDRSGEFGFSMAFLSQRFIRSGAVPAEVHYVPANIVRRFVRRGLFNLRRLMDKSPLISTAPVVIGGGVLLALSFVGNLDALRATRATRHTSIRGHKSSFVLRLTIDAPVSADTATLSPSQAQHLKKRRQELYAIADEVLADRVPDETRKPRYDRCFELREKIGLASLGIVTNQLWYDDPRRFAAVLARYRFVAKMLSGCQNIGEVGCGDAFATRVVLQEVAHVAVYDSEPRLVDDIRQRQDERWPLEAEVHDILMAPLPRTHAGVFSLNMLEHIAPEDEHIFLTNLCGSLADNGLLLLGTPSLSSQSHASTAKPPDHGNRRSDSELKALLGKYFEHVFLFPVSDEVGQTGEAQAANYLFALCSGPKQEMGSIKRRGREAPLFQICEQIGVPGFYVRVTYPNSEPQRVDGFTTVSDAARWIATETLDWLRTDRPTSH